MLKLSRNRRLMLPLCILSMLAAGVPATISVQQLINVGNGIKDINQMSVVSRQSRRVLDLLAQSLPGFTTMSLELTPDEMAKFVAETDRQFAELEEAVTELRSTGARLISKQSATALSNAVADVSHSWEEIREQTGVTMSPVEKTYHFLKIFSEIRKARQILNTIDANATTRAQATTFASFKRAEKATIMILASILGAALIGLVTLYTIFHIARTIKQSNQVLRDKNQEIEDLNETLEDRIEHRTSELRLAHQELEANMKRLSEAQKELIKSERLSALGQVTATMSHEIRNPLGAIRSSLYVVREAVNKANIKLDRPLNRIERSVTRCDNIIGDFLEYSRTKEVSLKTVDGSEFLNEVLDEQTIPAGIALTRDLPRPGAQMAIDPERFRRVIINLVDNAAQAIQENRSEGGEIAVSCHARGRGSVIHIRDNGPGIPDEVLAKIFEPLFTTKSFGAGLGLPTVNELVKQHWAELTIDTQCGVGTTFSVLLPPASAVNAEINESDIEEKAA